MAKLTVCKLLALFSNFVAIIHGLLEMKLLVVGNVSIYMCRPKSCGRYCCFRSGLQGFDSAGIQTLGVERHLRNDDISHEQFTCDLKTFLFTRAYLSEAPLGTSV